MRRIAASLLSLALMAPAFAAEDDHDHVAEVEGLRVLHAWTPATTGGEALIYLEIENTSDQSLVLTGAESGTAEASLVGFSYIDGEARWTPLPEVSVPPGSTLEFAPNVLALRLSDLPGPLTQGADLDVELQFGAVHLEVAVEVGAPDATAHSHAGHAH